MVALKEDEPYSEKCSENVGETARRLHPLGAKHSLSKVCGTLARKVGINIAAEAKRCLDRMIHPRLLMDCNKAFCASAYPLCREYDIYSIDAIYLK